MKKGILVLLLVVFSTLAYGKDISNKTALEMIKNPDVVMLDVRTLKEYNAVHIDGVVLIDFYSKTFKDDVAKLDKSKTYVLFCRTDNRSGQAMKMMKSMGFKDVYNVMGGMVKWISDKLPLTRN